MHRSGEGANIRSIPQEGYLAQHIRESVYVFPQPGTPLGGFARFAPCLHELYHVSVKAIASAAGIKEPRVFDQNLKSLFEILTFLVCDEC